MLMTRPVPQIRVFPGEKAQVELTQECIQAGGGTKYPDGAIVTMTGRASREGDAEVTRDDASNKSPIWIPRAMLKPYVDRERKRA